MSASPRERYFSVIKWATVAALVVGACFNFRVMVCQILEILGTPIEDMTHGYFIPLVSLYALWKTRGEWPKVIGHSSFLGLAAVLVALVPAFFGGRGEQPRIEQLALIGLLIAVPWALWGRGAAKHMLFPAFFLLFSIPISTFIDFCTVHLRIFSATLSALCVNGLGVAVRQSGSSLISEMPGMDFSVDVAAGCSGIRSLFAILAFSVAWTHFCCHCGSVRKLATVCSAVPIAVLGNIIRLVTTCLVTGWLGKDIGIDIYHDYVGFPIFLLEIWLVMLVGARLDRAAPRAVERAEAAREPAPESPGRLLSISAVLLFTCGWVFVTNVRMPPPTYGEPTFVADDLPATLAGYQADRPFFCHELKCLATLSESELVKSGKRDAEGKWHCAFCSSPLHPISAGEYNDLPKDTQIRKRNFVSREGVRYDCGLVIGGRGRGSLHRAELCLPAQGYAMMERRNMTFRAGGYVLPAKVIHAVKAGRSPISLVYWLEGERHRTSSHFERIWLDIWDRSFGNRIGRWAMTTVVVSENVFEPAAKERFERFLADLVPRILKKERDE